LDTQGSITSFLAEFSIFESLSVRSALRSLSKNDAFALKAEHLLALDARLTLVKRMAFVRNLDPVDCDEIARIEERTKQLVARRDELFHVSHSAAGPDGRRPMVSSQNATSEQSRRERETVRTLWKPTIAEIDRCRSEISDIQSSLTAIVDRLECGAHQSGATLCT
jgi:hypothetical protein